MQRWMMPLWVGLLLHVNLFAQSADETFRLAATRSQRIIAQLKDSSKIPVTLKADGSIQWFDLYDWRSGFFAGNLWRLYEYSKDEAWLREARRWTAALEPLQYFTGHHDLGFMVYCSYGAGYQLTGDEQYKKVLVQAAKSLCTRFNEVTGTIKSWDTFTIWKDGRKYNYPVIVDNMMNLELLFFASKVTGDPYYRKIALTHADNTIKNHFRKDFSSYHVVCYDSLTGKVLARETYQGYANESAWSRGQAWALYGFTIMYRETRDKRYLKQAAGIARYLMNHPAAPSDLIPYWDYHAGNAAYKPCTANAEKHGKGQIPRDASAGAIIASALLELSDYVSAEEAKKMVAYAQRMLESLTKPFFLGSDQENPYFLLKHSVGSAPHGGEVDVPLIYADYYFLEALMRWKAKK